MVTLHQLDTMSRVIRSWLEFQKESRDREGLGVGSETVFVCMDMPAHPTRSMLEAWVVCLEEARDEIARLT